MDSREQGPAEMGDPVFAESLVGMVGPFIAIIFIWVGFGDEEVDP